MKYTPNGKRLVKARRTTRIPELKHKDTKNTKKDKVSDSFGLSPDGWSSKS
jgi:hypothetical protein